MRSAVPLPCFFDVAKLQSVAGQRPRQGTKSCRMGRNLARPCIRLSNRPFVCYLEASCWGLRACQRGLRACQRGLRACQEDQGGDGRTDGWTDGRTEGQNFSPFYRTSSPVGAAAQKAKNYSHEKRKSKLLRNSQKSKSFFDFFLLA